MAEHTNRSTKKVIVATRGQQKSQNHKMYFFFIIHTLVFVLVNIGVCAHNRLATSKASESLV